MQTAFLFLSDGETNKRYYICETNLREKYAAKLYKLGVASGETVTIERKIGKSTLILSASGTIVAIGREIAEKIRVIEVNHAETSR